MPVGKRKNALYAFILPVAGLRCRWKTVHTANGSDRLARSVAQVCQRNHVVGGCVQRIQKGALTERYLLGNASLSPLRPVTEDTYFRTASIAKMVCTLLVMRLQTLGQLNVQEDISAFWGSVIRNPAHPEIPIPLGALLSHTSGITDSPAYFSSYRSPVTVDKILADGECFNGQEPFKAFQYSNFAAGLVGCLLEKRFNESLETLAQRELFLPLGARATFDITTLAGKPVADSYRVLPASRQPVFCAEKRMEAAQPLSAPDPQQHYLLASGGLFLTAEALARLALPLMNGGLVNGDAFLSPQTVHLMKDPLTAWPEPEVNMRHGMGLLSLDDRCISPSLQYGHQGFAYGAVNGVFWDERGNGFVSLNNGASEKRVGHLSCLNRDLISIFQAGENL